MSKPAQSSRLTRIFTSSRYRSIAFSLFSLFIVLTSAANAGTAQYFYDPGGRLTGMLDPTTGTAQYSYDQSGNITAIVRNPLSALTVLQVSPSAGAVGATVTIAGTAFGNTSNTSVSFNGVSATPTTVTTTSLTVAVPSGATTGSVSVTAPTGTVAATSPFTVLSTASPTISSFTTGTGTPTIAAPGATVTITGTNFDPVNSKALVNGQFARITSASTTSLSIVVPPSSSGKIGVETPIGSALSTTDLTVVPPPFAPSAVAAAVRTTVGASAVSVTQGGSGTVSLILFDVTAGERVNIRFNTTGNPGCPAMSVLGPGGNAIFPPSSVCSNAIWTDQLVLPQAGTYSIEVVPNAGSGSVTAQIIDVPPDATSTVSTSGVTAGILITTPGQKGAFTFLGTAGQKVAILIDPVNLITSTCAVYSVAKPDGLPIIVSNTCSRVFVSGAVITLPETGTYTIPVSPVLGSGLSDGTGSVSVTVFAPPPDVTASLSFGGTEAALALVTPGQNGSFTFSGTSGQKVNLFLDFDQLNNCAIYAILNPDNSTFISQTTQCGSTFVHGAPLTLPQTGTYTISILPRLETSPINGTGQPLAAIFNVPADATSSVVVGGPASTIFFSTPGQHGGFNFSGTAAQKVVFWLGFSTFASSCSNYTVLNPDASTLTGPSTQCGNGFLNNTVFTLPQTGTYTIPLVPTIDRLPTDGTGIARTAVFVVPADATGTVTIGGATSTLAFGTPGQHGSFTFSGTTGQKIVALLDFNQGLTCANYSILNPDSSTLVNPSTQCGRNTVSNLTLPQTGTYKIPITPTFSTQVYSGTGSAAVTLSLSP